MNYIKSKASICLLAATMAFAPIAPASAHDHWGHGGPLVGLFALGAAAVVGTAAILTAPINALAAQPGYYAPAPNYYAQNYYAQPAPYYARPAYYAPQGYYAQAPAYYAAPQGYYYYGR